MFRYIGSMAVVCVLMMTSAVSFAGEMRIPIGLTYVSGMNEIVDLHEDNLRAEGNKVESTTVIPVGLSVHPNYETGFGLAYGAGIGPVMMILGDTTFWNVPVGLDFRYSLPSRFNTSPYIRAGARYHIAGGDYVESSTPGFFGGIGMTFLRTRKVGMGFEVAVDTSSIEFEKKHEFAPNETEDIEPALITVSIYAVL
ncbi:hypothetical protein H8D64_02670 [PVC group bacterium]|nr:hypothetical protein [PVC group bacterium]